MSIAHIHYARQGYQLACVLAIVMVAHCERKAVEGCIWHNAVSLNFLWLWHAVVFLTRMAWIGSWLWKQDPKTHDITWAFEAIMSLWHLSALLTVLHHLAVYGRFLRAKTRVSELEVRYTVPEVKGEDGVIAIQTARLSRMLVLASEIVTDATSVLGRNTPLLGIYSRIRRNGCWFQSVLRSFLRSGI